jgi:opacity protein-like surface antigen
MNLWRTLGMGLLFVTLSPAIARADGFIVPFAGVNFGGNAGDEDFGDAADAKRFNFGVSLGWMGGGVFGVEADFAYSPDFYGETDLGGSGVTSFMGNLLVGVPFGGQQGFGIRPFGLVGIGLLRSNLEEFDEVVGFDNNEVGWNFGGGLMFFFSSHVGLRGDVRYFRTFNAIDFGFINVAEEEHIDFARGAVGLVVRF